jgi:hypothetical protein
MLTVNFLQFFFNLIIANLVLKMLAIYLQDTQLGDALAFLM